MTQPHEQSDPKRDEQPKRDGRRPEDAPKTTQLRSGGEKSHRQPEVKRLAGRLRSRQLQETNQIEKNQKTQTGKSVGEMEAEHRARSPEQPSGLYVTRQQVSYRHPHAADIIRLIHVLSSVNAPCTAN